MKKYSSGSYKCWWKSGTIPLAMSFSHRFWHVSIIFLQLTVLYTNKTKPEYVKNLNMVLVTPHFYLRWQVKMSAVKQALKFYMKKRILSLGFPSCVYIMFWGANAERNGGLNGSYLLRMFRVIIMTGMQLGLTLWIFQTLQTDCWEDILNVPDLIIIMKWHLQRPPPCPGPF